MNKSIHLRAGLIVVLSIFLSAQIHGAIITWTDDDTVSNFGIPLDSWSDGGEWSPGTVPGAGDTAVFNTGIFDGEPGNADGGVNVVFIDSANMTVGNIFFDTNAFLTTNGTEQGYDIGGQGLGPNGNYALGLAASGTIGILPTFLGTGVTQTITAPLVLGGNATFSNNSVGNTLLFSGGISAPGMSSTITLTGSGGGSITNTISNGGGGTVSVDMAGPGTWVLSGDNSYSGPTEIDGGILNVGSLANVNVGSSLGVGSPGGSAADLVFGGGTLQYTGATAQSTNRLFTIGDANGSTATIDSSGANSGAYLTFTSSGALGVYSTGSNTLILTGSNTSTTNVFTPAIPDGAGGSTSLVKNGPGEWVLYDVSNYTGTTTINGGILNVDLLANIDTPSNIGDGSVAGSAADLVFGGGTLQYSLAGGVSTNRLFTIGDANGLTATLDSSGANSITMNFTGTGALGLGGSGARTLTFQGTDTDSNVFDPGIGDGLGGSTSVVKSGASTWVLGGTNSYSGTTAINGGILKISGSSNLGNGSSTNVIVFNGGVLESTANSYSLSQPITLDVAGTIQTDSGTLTLSGSIANGANLLTVTGSSNTTISGIIGGGSGGVTKSGTGTLTLQGGNTFTGALTLLGGDVNAATANISSASSIIFNGGILQAATGGISTAQTVTMTGAGTFDTNGNNSTLSGVVTGGGALTKIGPGTLTLSGPTSQAPTFTGGLVINNGTVQDGNGSNPNVLGSGIVTFGTANTPTLDLDGNNPTTGLLSGSSNAVVTNSLTSSTATLTVATSGGAQTFAGVIQDGNGQTGFTVLSGAQTLSGTNTYTGNTTINGGSLILDTGTNTAGNILNSSSALVMNGGIFQLISRSGANSQAVNGLTLDGAGIVTVNNLGTSGSISLGTITRVAGGAVDFDTTQGTAALGVGSIINTTNVNDASGIIGAWATTGTASALASVNASGNIVPYAGYTTIADRGSTIANNANTNVETTSVGSGANIALAVSSGTTSIETLTQGTTTSGTVAISAGQYLQTGTVGGIFITPGSQALTIGATAGTGVVTAGGSTTGVNGELILNNASSNTLTMNSVIANNGTGVVSLTKAGTGGLILAGANTYTGTLTIDAGNIQVNNANGLGPSTNTIVFNGGSLDLSNSGNGSWSQAMIFGLAGGTINQAAANNNINYNGVISGPGALITTGIGTPHITNTANSFTGPIIIAGSGGNAILYGTTASLNAMNTLNGIALDGGSLGANIGSTGLATDKSILLEGGGALVPEPGAPLYASGVISGAQPLTINLGSGTVFLSGANTFTNQVQVFGGTLNAPMISIADSSGITLNGGAAELQMGSVFNTSETLVLDQGFIDTNGYSSTFSGSVFGNGGGGVFGKLGAGTLTFNSTSDQFGTSGGSLSITGGTLLLDFANLASGDLFGSSSTPLTLGDGALSIKGKSGGTTTETLGNLTINGNSSNALIVAPNGSSSTTLALGSTWTRSAGGSLLINLSAAGNSAFDSTLSSQTLGYAVVENASGVGFASANGSFITPLSGQSTLITSSSAAGTDFIIAPTGSSTSGAPELTMAGNFSANTLTINTASATGANNLDLGGGTMTLTQLGLLMTGSNNFTIQDGQVGASASEVIINQFGTGTLTVNAPISSGAGRLTTAGSGTVVLGVANTYTGATVVNGGTLQLNASLASPTFVLNSTGSLLLNAASTLSSSAAVTFGVGATGSIQLNGNNLAIASLNSTLNSNNPTGDPIIQNASATPVTFSPTAGTFGGIIQDGAGGGALSLTTGAPTQSANATLTLSGPNTYSGNTTVGGGDTLALDFTQLGAPVSNIINNTANNSALIMSANTTLNVIANAFAANTQQFNGVTLGSGQATMEVTSLFGGSATVSLGAIIRNAGSDALFITPTLAAADGSGAFTTTNGNTNGILGAWATYNGNDWAAVTSGTVGAYSGYVNDTWAPGNNTTITTGASVAASSTTSTLRFAAPGAVTLTLSGTNVIQTGGILESSAVGSNSDVITGGYLTSGGGELLLASNDSTTGLTISSVITGNINLTKYGTGAITLAGANNYVGTSIFNGGSVLVTNVNALGPSTNPILLNGGSLDLTGIDSNGASWSQNITVGPGGGTLAFVDFGFNTTFSGLLSGSGALTLTGGGTPHITNTANTFTGPIIIGLTGGNGILFGSTATLNALNSTNGITFTSTGWLEPIAGSGGIATTKSISMAGAGNFGPSTTAPIYVSGDVSGGSEVTINGSGVLYLSGTNSFTGGILINAGSVNVTSNSIGTGAITFNNGSALVQLGSAVSTADAIGNSNTVGTIDTNGNAGIFSGVFSGVSGTTLTKTGAGTLTINNAANTFSGAVVINGGTLLLDFVNRGGTANELGAGTGALTLADGTLSIKGNSGAVGTTQAFGNLTISANTSAGIVLNPNGGTSTTLTLGSTWTRSAGGSLLINLSAAGTSSLASTLAAQTLGYAVVENNASGIGFARANGSSIGVLTGQTALATSSSNAATDFIAAPTGASTSGSPFLTMGGNFSADTLTINTASATGANFLDLGAGTMTLATGGLLMTGSNNFTIQNGQLGAAASEVIINQFGSGTLTVNTPISSGAGRLTVDGGGAVILGVANTYTGTTVINGGTLQLNASLASPAIVLNSTGGLVLNAASTLGNAETVTFGIGATGSLALNGNNLALASLNTTLNDNNTAGAAIVQNSSATPATLTVTAGTFSGIIQDGAGGGSLSLATGANSTLTLTGANTYSGTTTVNGAETLTLDFTQQGAPVSNIINNSADNSALVMNANATLNVIANAFAANTQQFNGLLLNSGASTLEVTSVLGGSATISLGAITRLNDSDLQIITPTLNGGADGSGAFTTTNVNTNGILGAWATYNGNDWAAVTSGTIGAYSGYTNDTWAPGNNTTITTGATVATSSTTNTLRFAAPSAVTLTLSGTNVIQSGGILESSAVGSNSDIITGGYLTSGAGEMLLVSNNTTSPLAINSIITGNVNLTKYGSGTISLGGVNNYTGTTTFNAGTVNVTNSGALGASTNSWLFNGGAVDLDADGVNGGDWYNNLTIGPGGGTLSTAAHGYNTYYYGVVSGSGALTFIGTGQQYFNNTVTTFTGPITVNMSGNNGILYASTAGLNLMNSTNGITLAGGALGGYGGGLATDKNIVLTGGGLTAGDGSTYVSGAIGGSSALIISGPGNYSTQMVYLTGSNTFTGTVVENSGWINITSASVGDGTQYEFNNGSAGIQFGSPMTFAEALNTQSQGVLDTNGYAVTMSGVISNGNAITKSGAGTLTVNNAANTWTGGSLVINGGTVLLDFVNKAASTNLLGGASTALTLGDGTLSLKGKSGVVDTQAYGNLTLSANTSSGITITPNSSTSTTLTLGSTWTRNAGSSLLINLSAAGTGTLATGLAAGTLGYAVVENNSGGIGFASANTSVISVLTGQSTLITSSSAAGTDFIIAPTGSSTSGAPELTMAGNFSANTLTINTASASGANFLDLGTGTATLTQLGLLMTGNNNFTIQDGQLGAAASEVIVNQFGTGTLTLNTPISSGTGRLTVEGTGTVALGAANTYTGGTVINGGTLELNAGQAQIAPAFVLNGTGSLLLNAASAISNSPTVTFGIGATGSIELNGNNLFLQTLNTTYNSNNATGAATIQNANATPATLTVTAGTFGGVIQDGIGGGALSLTTGSDSALTLVGSNTYSGNTTIGYDETLTLDFSQQGAPANNIINNTTDNSTLVVNGGSGLSVIANAFTNSTQQFNGLVLNGGAAMSITSLLGGSVTVNLGAITPNIGGAVAFSTPTTALSDGWGAFTTTTANTNGILGGYATFDGNDWAAVTSGTIGAYTGYINDTWAPGNNTTITTGAAVATSSTTNSLRFASGTPVTLTLTGTNVIQSGGILESSAVGSSSDVITGGSITSSGSDLYLVSNDSTTALSVNSSIIGNITVVKYGAGTITLQGTPNTFTGSFDIDGGVVNAYNSGSLEGQPVFIATGATLDANGVGTIGSLSGNGTLQVASSLALSQTTNTVFTGAITGGGTLSKNGDGTLIFDASTNTANKFSTSGVLDDNAGGITVIGNATTAVTQSADAIVFNNTAQGGDETITVAGEGANLTFNMATGNGISRLYGNVIDIVSSSIGTGTNTITWGNSTTTFYFMEWNSTDFARMVGGTISSAAPLYNNSGVFTGWANPANWTSASSTYIVSDTSSTPYTSGTVTASNAALTGLRISNASTDTITIGSGANLAVSAIMDVQGAGAFTIAGPGALDFNDGSANDQIFYQNNTANTLTIAAPITGSSPVTKSGPGTLIFTGTNNYTAGGAGVGTYVNNGTLQLGAGGTTGNLGAGTVSLNNTNSTLAFDRTDSSTVSNTIFGVGSVQQIGSGSTTLSANNTYTGPTTVSAGTLVVSGSISGSSITVANGATLASGNNTTSEAGGASNTLTVNGALSPGGSGGSGLTSIGELTTGALTLGNTSLATLNMELGGTTAGMQYDQVAVPTGSTVNLDNVNLQLSLVNSYTPAFGNMFFLIINAGTVNGAFANTPGNQITIDGQQFSVSYDASYGTDSFTGGDDVALMAVPEPDTWMMLLSGAGVLLFWRRSRRR